MILQTDLDQSQSAINCSCSSAYPSQNLNNPVKRLTYRSNVG